MKIMVIGASGRVGKLLTEELLRRGHQVTGTTRRREQLFSDKDYEQIALDLTVSKEKMKTKFPEDLEAVYFVSGSRGKSLLQVDLNGAVKTMEIVKELGIRRYVMLSAIHSLDPEKFYDNRMKSLMDYYLAKYYADLYLLNTDLAYTILQPGSLTEGVGSGKIAVNVEEAKDSAIENVALTLAGILEVKILIGK